MNTELHCPGLLELEKRLLHLLLCHSVLGIAGSVHNLNLVLAVCHTEHAAGIVTAADCLGNSADLLDKLNMGVVVKVDHRAEVVCFFHVLGRSYV